MNGEGGQRKGKGYVERFYINVSLNTGIHTSHGNINQCKYKAWFKRGILHAPNQILILVDSN